MTEFQQKLLKFWHGKKLSQIPLERGLRAKVRLIRAEAYRLRQKERNARCYGRKKEEK